jgi:MFS family permease
MSEARSDSHRKVQWTHAIQFVFGRVEFPGARRWGAALLIDATGSGLLRPITILYFTVYRHLSVSSVGLALGVCGTIALCAAPLAGGAVDRFGPKPALLMFWVVEATSFASYALVRSWDALVIAAAFALAATTSTNWAKTAVLTEIVNDDQRVQALSFQRSLRNIGFGIGGLLATAALAVGGNAYLLVILADAASYLVAIALVTGLPATYVRRPAHDRADTGRSGYWLVLRDRRYLALAALDFFARANQTALVVALPLWIVFHTDAPAAMAGALYTLNTVVVALFQVRVTAGIRQLADTPSAYRRAAAAMCLAAGAYLLAHYAGEALAILLLVLGLVSLTMTEILVSAGEWSVSLELADAHHRGKYLSIYSLGNGLQTASGATIVTSILTIGTTWLWPALGVMIAAGCAASAQVIRRALPRAVRSDRRLAVQDRPQ